ncbi:MAG: hypothetical protein KatS3mg068_2639 [Candidatus Sericytochromatia bacterium]|nr:MAG: hypothetical protein KatS3mg068_2639 [Candidatus Sericytochromatia bacterium]GIX41952.1 MAG: hypothetical protein KatS3mg129_1685 [Leptospiraceae bacterium]
MEILKFIFLHSELASESLQLQTIPSEIPFHPLFVHAPIVLTFLIPLIGIFSIN